MKRIAIVLIAVLLFAGMAFAENTESPTIASAVVPSVTIKAITGIGAELGTDFLIEIAEPDDAYALKLEEIVAVAQTQELAGYFGAEAMAKAAELLPVDADIANVQLDEFYELYVAGYSDAYGDVDVSFTCVTEYKAEDVLLAMVGVDAKEETIWLPLKAAAVDGDVVVTFTQEAVQIMNGKQSSFVLLRVV